MKRIFWQTRAIYAKLFFSFFLFTQGVVANECKEIEKELQQLEKLQKAIEQKIEKNEQLLQQIKQEKESLEAFRKTLNQEVENLQSERFKKLAKDFESMDPEYAGEKLSQMEPKIAAYILFNMKSRKAGEALNFVSGEMVNKISKILTQLKQNGKK